MEGQTQSLFVQSNLGFCFLGPNNHWCHAQDYWNGMHTLHLGYNSEMMCWDSEEDPAVLRIMLSTDVVMLELMAY